MSRFPSPPEDAAQPSSRFVNKVRGGLPPEISADEEGAAERRDEHGGERPAPA